MTVLYHYWRSSASYRVRIALAELGVAFDAVTVNLLDGSQRGDENLARNPQGLVPTLEIDGLRLTQSLAIIDYLNETRGGGLLPGDAAGRARVRALSHAVAMEIAPICNLSVGRYAVDHSGGGVTQEGWMRHFIGAGFAALDRMLDGAERFCHGARLTMADCCLVPQVFNARRWGVDMTSFPTISRVDAALAEHPAVLAAHPERWKTA